MAITEIEATARPRAGKGAARAARREGLVPAVIYGDKKEPTTISLSGHDLKILINRGKFLSSVFDIKVKDQKIRVLPRDIQFHPVKDIPLHVDFQRVPSDGRIRVFVPVEFLNEATSPGLKRGGVLNVVRHEVEVFCPADNIPKVFEIDLGSVDIGTSIHISSVKLPEGVSPTITSRDFTVATLAGSASAKSDAAGSDGEDKPADAEGEGGNAENK